MKELISQMLKLEIRAAEFYQFSSDYFQDRRDISEFLCTLSEEEESHYRILQKAVEYAEMDDNLGSNLTIEEDLYNNFQSSLDRAIDQITAGTFSVGDLLNILSMIEFSEWNGLFFYVVNSLKDRSMEFKSAAIKIQHHLRNIQNFIVMLGDSMQYAYKIRDLPTLWSERILIVDDDESVAGMLESLLKNDGIVETAGNGIAALEKLKNRYYSVIISDITMPHMDGISFYKEASKNYRNISRRFIFFSANPTEEQIEFIQTNSLKFMSKPTNIQTIKENVYQVMTRNVESLQQFN